VVVIKYNSHTSDVVRCIERTDCLPEGVRVIRPVDLFSESNSLTDQFASSFGAIPEKHVSRIFVCTEK